MAYARHRPGALGSPDAYDWHLPIPARDEAAVIANTVDMPRLRFPVAHVWVVEDTSLDATAGIVHAPRRETTTCTWCARTYLRRGPARGTRSTVSMAGFTNEYTMDTLVDQEGLPSLRRPS